MVATATRLPTGPIVGNDDYLADIGLKLSVNASVMV